MKLFYKLHKIFICSLVFSFTHLCYADVKNPSILKLLQITPSSESIDYVNNKKQFQLHGLLTEQRHPKTWNLSDDILQSTAKGVRALLSVDQDISNKFEKMAHDPEVMKELHQASQAIETAILTNKKIYIYGCGATGRLAIQLESNLWRPFWEKLATTPEWKKIKNHLPNIENRVIGTMTGGDRALISSLEGLEDLQLIGKLQLENNHIAKNDVVFAITEGGETSSVIGTILAAAKLYGNEPQKNLYYVYNNPDKVLLPFERSRAVIENNAIVKIRLATGPQAFAGSTRLQATTSEFYLMGILFQNAMYNVLKRYLNEQELANLGFAKSNSLQKLLVDFRSIQKTIYQHADEISQLTELEAKTYASQHHATYMAQEAIVTVFTDSTERSPTFRLSPLDTIDASERKAWIQVWTTTKNQQAGWQMLLHHPFRGLETSRYKKPFSHD